MKIDKRTATDIENRIAELAASYVPEWNFDRENPDIGSTLAILFAGQMKDNIDRFNQVLDIYHTSLSICLTCLFYRRSRPARWC